ncbi:hypothetical protein BH23PLA1_BH23PLA1_07290 [soil metagenome]
MRSLGVKISMLAILLVASSATADEFQVETLKETPPADLAPAILETLQAEGFRILDDGGEPYADVWLCKTVKASSEPSGAKGAILYPFLESGQLLGALRFNADGFDYRYQLIEPGLYTMRYGLQPVDGDHLGVSTYRDYALLIPAELDKSIEPLDKPELDDKSADAAGTSHPATFILLPAPDSAKDSAAITRDEAKDLWGVVLPLTLEVQGHSEPKSQPIQMIVLGAAGA